MNNDVSLRIAVTGATGRMGKALIQCITTTIRKQYNEKVVLGAVIARTGSNICGMDVGLAIIKKDFLGVIVTDNLNSVKNDFDVLIDFTSPDISIEYLKFCIDNNKNMVIGTTGFNKNHQSFIKDASQKIGIVYSANFSIGVTLMLKLLNIITKVMGNIADINIIETHHNKKIDIPSGTALMMKEIIINTLSSLIIDDKKKINYSHINNNKKFDELSLRKDISIHSIRSGNFVGEHSVLFASAGEVLQITHKAYSRTIFAEGALYSAIWLSSKKGLFNICDVLNV